MQYPRPIISILAVTTTIAYFTAVPAVLAAVAPPTKQYDSHATLIYVNDMGKVNGPRGSAPLKPRSPIDRPGIYNVISGFLNPMPAFGERTGQNFGIEEETTVRPIAKPPSHYDPGSTVPPPTSTYSPYGPTGPVTPTASRTPSD
jgi:hypothetical protein